VREEEEQALGHRRQERWEEINLTCF
jgi:hypothetical protein